MDVGTLMGCHGIALAIPGSRDVPHIPHSIGGEW